MFTRASIEICGHLNIPLSLSNPYAPTLTETTNEKFMNAKSLLLLHGALGSKVQLSRLMDELSQSYQVYTMDFEDCTNYSSLD